MVRDCLRLKDMGPPGSTIILNGFTLKKQRLKWVRPLNKKGFNNMKRAQQNYFPLSVTYIIAIILLSSFFVITAQADNPTVVRIDPASQTVSAGSSVVLTVNCSPARSVKGFELKVSFDPSILQATSVSEGNFFTGFTTFFNPGTINNQAGTIINVYDLIVGQGNVTSNGSFVTIAFTAGSTSGTSAVTLYGVQLANETEYINVSVRSASVTVTGGSSPPGGGGGPPVSPPSGNEPPGAPVKPVGPTFIEMGTAYAYNSSAVDPEGGRVRLRFDWGDGTMSDWSSWVASNASVSLSHTWGNVSSYNVRAIAQDAAGANSTWSELLTVIISQAVVGNQSPVASFVSPPKISSNQSVMFNASGSVDPDGVIVSYVWEFGDGTQGTGKTPTHEYQSAGHYTVTLTVTDDTGLTSSVTMVVTVFAQATSPLPVAKASSPSYYLPLLALVGFLGALLVFVVVFRDPLRAMLSRRTPVPSGSTMGSSDPEVSEIEELLDALFLDMQKQAIPVSKENLLDAYCDLIIENVEAGEDVHLPDLDIAAVEKIVDERFHSKVSEQIDKL